MKALAAILLVATAIAAFVWWRLGAVGQAEPEVVVTIYEASAICHAAPLESATSFESTCDGIGAQLSTAMRIPRGASVAIKAFNNVPADTIQTASASLTASGYVVSDIHTLKAGFVKDE